MRAVERGGCKKGEIPMGRLFGTDGVRGVAGEDMTCELAMDIGRAAATVLTYGRRRRPLVVLGKDTRLSSDMLGAALSAGLCSVGADVIDLGVVPTPAVAYLVGKYKADAGVMISASHNPYQFNGINVITAEWMKKGDQEKNDVMVAEWQMLVDAFKDNGIEVVEVEARPEFEVMTFARDYGCMIKEGAVIGHFRHPVRQVEAVAYEEKLKEMGVPIVARVNAGCMEGGDFWMIDEHTLAFGQVDRTDQAGVDNLRDQLQKFGYTVVGVPCPPDNLHLDMIFNIVAPQVALACIDQLPYNFLQMLKRRNFELIPVASEDMYKHGCNVQCIGNGKVVAIEKNKHINDKMRALGLDVIDVPLDQILHAGGGPHCLTQPIERP